LATRWTTEAKRAQVKTEASHDTLRATQLATKLKAVLNGSSILELGRAAGCYAAALAKCGFRVTVADPCKAALDAAPAACDTVASKLESITGHFDVVLLADAATDLDGTWESALLHIKRVIKPKFLLLIDDRDVTFIPIDTAHVTNTRPRL
jgi:2-polyprenyl-3-methyl-5-hydroxy-6-metoxy-1,4-benzoquinol methylase